MRTDGAVQPAAGATTSSLAEDRFSVSWHLGATGSSQPVTGGIRARTAVPRVVTGPPALPQVA